MSAAMPRFVIRRLFLVSIVLVSPAWAAKIVLKDGRTMDGRVTSIAKVDEKAEELGKTAAKFITVIDDGLRRMYVARYNISQVIEENPPPLETFRTRLEYAQDGLRVEVLGEFDNQTRFDDFGRRLLTIRHGGGTEYFTQSITELNPYYVRARSMHMNTRPAVWDMRLATNSLPRDMLTPILMRQIEPGNLDDRIRLVRFYFGGRLYEAAEAELDGILQDWNDDKEVQQSLAPMSMNIRRQKYQRRLDELELRWRAGQYSLVRHWLDVLEKDERLPDQLFATVKRMILRYDDFEQQKISLTEKLKSFYDHLPDEEKDERIPPILDEISVGLSLGTMDRMATLRLYLNDETLADSEKLAIGITGWFAGPNADNRRLSVAKQFPETRTLLVDYLQSREDEKAYRQEILAKLSTLESARPDLIARMLAQLRPPKPTPGLEDGAEADEERPGFHRIEIDNPLHGTTLGAVEKIRYAVQLPPDYDPDRSAHYPMIVTLNGQVQTPETQIDWWAGSWRGKEREGHATRNGYIVIAPDWNPAEMRLVDYDFSAFPHAAVLYSVKDAFRRFNVDTDRVFISGHGIGGTAAWDIALAHPDLWAGAIPFNGVATKYIRAYHANANQVPLYLVCGELEGMANVGKWGVNAATLNNYLDQQANPPDVTVIRYIGRGVENFSDEILHLFDWMKLRQRNFVPMEFEAHSMRAWDYFFWWVELYNMEKERPECMTDPLEWPENNRLPKNMIRVTSSLRKAANAVRISVAPRISNTLVFLTPDMIDFGQKASVEVNGRAYHPPDGMIAPDLGTMLEDARTRSDRLHPFWAVLDGNTRKREKK